MLKKHRQLFEIFFVLSDLAVISIAWLVAYWIRFYTEFIPAEKGVPAFTNYLSMLLFVWLIWAFVFRRFGLYKPMRGSSRGREFWLLVNSNSLAVLLFLAVTYLFREKDAPFSRLVFGYFWVLAITFTVAERAFLRFLLREVRRRGYNLRYLLLIGAGQVAADVASRVRAQQELGIQLIGCLSREGTESLGPHGIPILGRYTDAGAIVRRIDVDQVVIAVPLEDHHLIPNIIASLGDTLVDVKIVPDVYRFVSVVGALEEFEGLPVINVRASPLDGVGFMVKRLIDLAISIPTMIALLPVMTVTSLLVKLSSRGPIFYTQERVSYDGTRFPIYKFRTMRTDAEASGPVWSQTNDSRITAIGRILRVLNLDELPQLWNVIRGDMSIVGPRPERPIFIDEFRRRVPDYMVRHKVPAGMTGWAQVHGWRGDTSIDKRIEYDLYYIENWSLLLDLKILFLTVFKGFRSGSAA